MTRASLLIASLLASVIACRPRPADSAGDGATTASSASAVQATPPSPSATTSSAAPDAGVGCIKFDAHGNGPKVTLEGIVHEGSGGHPNGSTFPMHVLELDRAICLEGEPGPVSEVQLLSPDDKMLARIVDKRVRLRGESAEPQTAYHRRPVMVHVEGEPTVLGAAPKRPAPAPAPRPSADKPPISGRPCGMSPSDWCPSPPGDPCGVHKNVKDCRADKRCKGMPYRGESFVACKDDGTGFASNCPTVGCISR
jgi:hypothetical protein